MKEKKQKPQKSEKFVFGKDLLELCQKNPRLAKALEYKGRREILAMINEKPRFCEEIAEARDVKPSGVYRHLSQIFGAGLIESYQEDANQRNVLYRITPLGKEVLEKIVK